MTLHGKAIGKGYAGRGAGLNNPDKEKEKNVGPIPAGLHKYRRAARVQGDEGLLRPAARRHTAHGRTGFLIHGDYKMDHSASEGCVILSAGIRKKVSESGVTKLRVVKE